MSKYLSKPNTNACHFCDKVYSANSEDIFATGSLFKVDETMVGVSHFNTVVACAACIRKRVRDLKAKMSDMLCEVSQLETGKRLERWYPPKKVAHKKCPTHGEYDFDEEDGYCHECGFHYCDEIEDPRQAKIRERREKKESK